MKIGREGAQEVGGWMEYRLLHALLGGGRRRRVVARRWESFLPSEMREFSYFFFYTKLDCDTPSRLEDISALGVVTMRQGGHSSSCDRTTM